jgi:hypothetical protein
LDATEWFGSVIDCTLLDTWGIKIMETDLVS